MKKLNDDDIYQLKKFLAEMDVISKDYPEPLIDDRRDDENVDTFRNKEKENRYDKQQAIIEKYHDVIVKVLDVSLVSNPDGGNVYNTIKGILSGNTEALPQIIAKQIKSVFFPIDKVNKNIWHLLEQPADGQLTLNFDVSGQGSEKPVNILYSLDFNNLKNISITRKLEPYDKRVYLAISALFNEGYNVINVKQIYKAMGYTGNASATDIKRINDAITKMNGAHLIIDNKYEAKNYKGFDHFKYDGVLLPIERMQAYINGQLADAAIHIFREPPMVSFAKQRKQITTINIKLLDSPLSKTNANIELEDYLIEEIARIKKGKRNSKMLFSTIYEVIHITTKKQKQRAPEKINKLLAHYKICGYIKNYKMDKDSVTINC